MAILELAKSSGVLDLKKKMPSLKELEIKLEWVPHPSFSSDFKKGFDLDIMVFCLNKEGKILSVSDVCYYDNPIPYSGALVLPKDERFGMKPEQMFINLGSVPEDKTSLQIFVFIFEAEIRNQHLGMIESAELSLINKVTGEIIQNYSLSQYINKTGIHIGAVTKNADGDWCFEPVGVSGNSDPEFVAGQYI